MTLPRQMTYLNEFERTIQIPSMNSKERSNRLPVIFLVLSKSRRNRWNTPRGRGAHWHCALASNLTVASKLEAFALPLDLNAHHNSTRSSSQGEHDLQLRLFSRFAKASLWQRLCFFVFSTFHVQHAFILFHLCFPFF